MKKITGIVLVLVFLLLAMTGCASGNGAAESDAEVESSVEVETEEETETEEKTEAAAETEEIGEKEFDTSATIEETVICDSDEITITATSLEYKPYTEGVVKAVVHLRMSNISDNIDRIYSNLWDNEEKINGILIDGGLTFLDVSPYGISDGKMDTSITFYSDDLQEKGINSIKEIQLVVHIWDTDWNEKVLDIEPIYTSLY